MTHSHATDNSTNSCYLTRVNTMQGRILSLSSSANTPADFWAACDTLKNSILGYKCCFTGLVRLYLRLCVIWLSTQVKASLDHFHLVAHSPCKHFCVGGLSGHECRLSATISPQINALTLQWTHKLNHDLQLWSQQSQSGIHNRITYNYCVLLYDQLRSYFILSCSWWWRGLPNAPHPPWQ